MSGIPHPLCERELKQYFPLKRDCLGPGIFELGLVLGGTVSAGAYTAGVLDLLMEALDAWTRAKERGDPAAPTHKVIISTVAGTSGGAINGAILTRAAGWDFPHGPDNKNPFYSSWTQGVDLKTLLSDQPEAGNTGLGSIFNCGAIDEQAKRTIEFAGEPLGTGNSPKERSYLADPLRLTMMVGNVTGVPYRIKMAGESQLSHDLVSHADYMRFALAVKGGIRNEPYSRPDELTLQSDTTSNWDVLQATSLATSAFPLAFRSRALRRGLAVCGYRATLIPGETGDDAEVAQLIPLWSTLMAGATDPEQVDFVNVDGGTINNEPLDMVRTALAGMDGRNKRNGLDADRAVLMVDPFSDPESIGPRQPPDLVGLAFPFIMSLVYQARFKPEDIALANSENVYSRFLIAPVGPAWTNTKMFGSKAIAAGGLGGFLGFVDKSFLEYDFRLGRRNAYDFLKTHFMFPEDHPIFKDWWTPDQRSRHVVVHGGKRFLPMIPMMADVPVPPEVTAEAWPKLQSIPTDLPDAVKRRLQFVYDQVLAAARPNTWWKRALVSSYAAIGWRFVGRDALQSAAIGIIEKSLKDRHLLVQD